MISISGYISKDIIIFTSRRVALLAHASVAQEQLPVGRMAAAGDKIDVFAAADDAAITGNFRQMFQYQLGLQINESPRFTDYPTLGLSSFLILVMLQNTVVPPRRRRCSD